jgi:hypothetical protein
MKMMAKKAPAKKAPAKKAASKTKVEVVALGMDDDKKMRAQYDMDTVMRAQEIMADKSRMAMVKKLAAKQAQMASKIAK